MVKQAPWEQAHPGRDVSGNEHGKCKGPGAGPAWGLIVAATASWIPHLVLSLVPVEVIAVQWLPSEPLRGWCVVLLALNHGEASPFVLALRVPGFMALSALCSWGADL